MIVLFLVFNRRTIALPKWQIQLLGSGHHEHQHTDSAQQMHVQNGAKLTQPAITNDRSQNTGEIHDRSMDMVNDRCRVLAETQLAGEIQHQSSCVRPNILTYCSISTYPTNLLLNP